MFGRLNIKNNNFLLIYAYLYQCPLEYFFLEETNPGAILSELKSWKFLSWFFSVCQVKNKDSRSWVKS
jgi:hypothetical protein